MMIFGKNALSLYFVIYFEELRVVLGSTKIFYQY